MQNDLISAEILLRTKSSISFSSNDCSYNLGGRLVRSPFTYSWPSCSSCCRCTFCFPKVPLSPSFLYGHSTFIPWLPSRKQILGGGECYFYRVPVYRYEMGIYGAPCFVKEINIGKRGRKAGKERYNYMVLAEKRKLHRLNCINEAEVVLSLLAENVDAYFDVRDSECASFRTVEVENKRNICSECDKKMENNDGLGSREGKSRREFELVAMDSVGKNKRTSQGCSGGSNLTHEAETIQVKSFEDGKRQNEERKKVAKGNSHSSNRGSSSSSSYYSFSSVNNLETDICVEVNDRRALEELPVRHRKESRMGREGRVDVKTCKDNQGHRKNGTEDITTESYGDLRGAEEGWRKMSEKKLPEVSVEQNKYIKESFAENPKVSLAHGSCLRKASSLQDQFCDGEEKLIFVKEMDKETRQQDIPTDNLITGQPKQKVKYQQYTEIPKVHNYDFKPATPSLSSSMEEDASAALTLVEEARGEHLREVGHMIRQGEFRGKFHQATETSEIEDNKNTCTLRRESETDVKNQREKSSLTESLVREAEKQQHQTGKGFSQETDLERNPHKCSDVSDIYHIHLESASALHSDVDSNLRTLQENSNFINSSHSEAKQECLVTDQRNVRTKEPRKGPLNVSSSISVVNGTNTERVVPSRRTSAERVASLQSDTTSVKSAEKMHNRRNLADEKLTHVGPKKEPKRKAAFPLEDSSSMQTSLDSVLQSRVLESEDGCARSSQTIVTPPLPQGFEIQERSRSPVIDHKIYSGDKSNETGSEPMHLISHEDALGSARLLEESSMAYVGEFVDAARHELPTYKTQIEKKFSTETAISEGEKQKQKGLRYGSQEYQLKGHGSRCSSESSGTTKGPSDEMWDVTNSSPREHSMIEAPERTTTMENAIARRTRSLWSVIADVVRMRWTQRAENRSSAAKSVERSSSNESVSSGTWFSGHEPDGNNNEDLKREKRALPQETSSCQQLKLEKEPMPNQEGPDAISSKEKMSHVETVTSSPSIILEIGSSSQGLSSTPGEEYPGYQSAKSFQSAPSSAAIMESSLPFPAGQSSISPTNVPESRSTGLIEEQLYVKSTLGTEGKDRELKQRKLQRTRQVPVDRFAEWEEAYKLESEQQKMDEMFMREALLEAKKAADAWEVPVGAVLVQNGKIVARGYNLMEERRDSTAHAEMICIREASQLLRTWRLAETTLYVTLEPCPMCAGAILQARIDTLVWGAPNKLIGADGSWTRLLPNGSEEGNGSEFTDKPAAPIHPFHPKMAIRRRVLAAECADSMQQFFKLRRKKKEKSDPPTPPSCLPVSNQPSKLLTKMHRVFNIMFCL